MNEEEVIVAETELKDPVSTKLTAKDPKNLHLDLANDHCGSETDSGCYTRTGSPDDQTGYQIGDSVSANPNSDGTANGIELNSAKIRSELTDLGEHYEETVALQKAVDKLIHAMKVKNRTFKEAAAENYGQMKIFELFKLAVMRSISEMTNFQLSTEVNQCKIKRHLEDLENGVKNSKGNMSKLRESIKVTEPVRKLLLAPTEVKETPLHRLINVYSVMDTELPLNEFIENFAQCLLKMQSPNVEVSDTTDFSAFKGLDELLLMDEGYRSHPSSPREEFVSPYSFPATSRIMFKRYDRRDVEFVNGVTKNTVKMIDESEKMWFLDSFWKPDDFTAARDYERVEGLGKRCRPSLVFGHMSAGALQMVLDELSCLGLVYRGPKDERVLDFIIDSINEEYFNPDRTLQELHLSIPRVSFKCIKKQLHPLLYRTCYLSLHFPGISDETLPYALGVLCIMVGKFSNLKKREINGLYFPDSSLSEHGCLTILQFITSMCPVYRLLVESDSLPTSSKNRISRQCKALSIDYYSSAEEALLAV